ncbi:MAG: integral rane protein [Actinomycetia bacterium]|jgi:drug/metabolite transporter (DMT)-like permease|nr:integral rane protein [Actinomycetes bacterium]
MVVVAALGSALAYALAMMLQHQSAQQVDSTLSLRPGLVVALLRRRWWLAGIAANLVAFALRAFALGHGSLVFVQPLVLSGLVFALALESMISHRPVSRREMLAGATLVAGLAVFLVAASPGRGRTTAAARSWLVLGAAITPLIALGLVAARRTIGERRAAWLAFAGAFLLAAVAALTKQSAAALSHGLMHALTDWAPYALVVVGGLGVLLTQSAFQAGALRASLPVLSIVEPLTSIAIGESVFHERIATSTPARAAQVIGLVFLMVGVASLTRSASPVVNPVNESGTMAP